MAIKLDGMSPPELISLINRAQVQLTTDLYIVAGERSEDPAAFIQCKVAVDNEVIDCELFEPWPLGPLKSLQDLLTLEGPVLPKDQRVRVRPPDYRLKEIIDVPSWLKLADVLGRASALRVSARSVRGADESTRPSDGRPRRSGTCRQSRTAAARASAASGWKCVRPRRSPRPAAG